MKKRQKKSFLKKHGLYPYLIIVAMLAILPILRYAPFIDEATPLHKAAESAAKLTVNMPFENTSYIIFNNNNNELITRGSGFSENFVLPAGNYRIEFAQINGYKSPEPRVFSYDGTSDFTIDGKYLPAFGYPLLGIKVFPENAKYIILDSKGKTITEGTGSQFFDMPVGNYKVQFLDIPGFSSPGQRNFYVANGVTTTVIAAYGQN
jgi:hypothetical protein